MALARLFKSFMPSNKVDLEARYEHLRRAISGTMSRFYMARDRQTKRVVGLKVLDVEKTRAFEARFKGLKKPSEGEISLLFKHPHIVETLEHGISTRDEPFLVMEYLDGPGLNSVIVEKSDKIQAQQLRLIRQMGEALAAVHEAGYIHRDVCPRNFVLARDLKSIKLIDFGLTVPATKEFMQPGNRTGTPSYMAPEVARRKPTDQRLDVFSFGATIYELLTFDLPWPRSKDGRDVITRDNESMVPIEQRRDDLDPVLARAVMTCLARSKEERLPSIKAFLDTISGVRPPR